MGVLSITTEDVLSRVSDEVQGFFFEELEKIAISRRAQALMRQGQRAIAGKGRRSAATTTRTLFQDPLTQGTSVLPPSSVIGAALDVDLARRAPPTKKPEVFRPDPELSDFAAQGFGRRPDPELSDFAAQGFRPERTPSRAAAGRQPDPKTPRGKPTPVMVEEEIPTPVMVEGLTPGEIRGRSIVPKDPAKRGPAVHPDGLVPEREVATRGQAYAGPPVARRGDAPTAPVASRTDVPSERPKPTQSQVGTTPSPARSRSRQNVTYEEPSWFSKATAGPKDVTDADIRAFAEDVALQRASIQTPEGLEFQKNNGPRIEAALREMKQRAASRVQAPPGITGRPAKPVTMDELRQESARQQRDRAAAPAWLKAQREGTSNIGNAEVDSFLKQHGTDFSALTGDAKKFYQANKGLIDQRARRMPPKTPKPTTSEAESATGKTYTDEEKREIAKQVSRDALARQEAQEKALNNAVEDLAEEGLKLDKPEFMPRLKKLLQPTGKIEFGTQRSEGELIEFLSGYKPENRQKALQAILRRNPAQYLNIGDEALDILGMSSEELIKNQRRFVDQNPQMILAVNKEMADKLGIQNYKRLRTAALAKATLRFGDQAAEAAGRDVLEAGARAARSGVDTAKDVASRAAQTARDTAARVRAAPGAAAGAAAGAARRVVEGAPAALEQAADAAGRAAGAAGRAAGAAGKLESDVAASYMGGLLGLDKDKLKGLSFVRSRATRANEINERINQIMQQGGGKGISDPRASAFGLSKQRAAELNDELSTLRAEKNRLIKEVADADFVDDRITSRFREAFKGDVYNPNARGFTDSVSGDGGVEMFGGTPTDPKIMDTLRSIIGGIIPPESATQEAADAASGLGKALSEINPAYLAAAAGATGVVGGLALTSTSPSPQNQQYGY